MSAPERSTQGYILVEQAVRTARLPLRLVLDMPPYILPQSLVLLHRLFIDELPCKPRNPGREMIITPPYIGVVVENNGNTAGISSNHRTTVDKILIRQSTICTLCRGKPLVAIDAASR
jgi:hypothetical protein